MRHPTDIDWNVQVLDTATGAIISLEDLSRVALAAGDLKAVTRFLKYGYVNVAGTSYHAYAW